MKLPVLHSYLLTPELFLHELLDEHLVIVGRAGAEDWLGRAGAASAGPGGPASAPPCPSLHPALTLDLLQTGLNIAETVRDGFAAALETVLDGTV